MKLPLLKSAFSFQEYKVFVDGEKRADTPDKRSLRMRHYMSADQLFVNNSISFLCVSTKERTKVGRELSAPAARDTPTPRWELALPTESAEIPPKNTFF